MVEWMPEAVLINSSTHQGYDCPRLPLDWGCWFLHYRGRTWSRWASLKSRTVEGLRGQALGSVKHPFIPRGKPVGTKSVHWVMGNMGNSPCHQEDYALTTNLIDSSPNPGTTTWVTHLVFLSLSFFLCKMEMTMAPTHWVTEAFGRQCRPSN